MQPDLTGDKVHVLVEPRLQVDDAVFAEVLHPVARAGAQRDEPVTGGDVENLAAGAVVPVGEPTSRQPSWCAGAPRTLIQPMYPQQLTRLCIDRDGGPTRAGGGVEHPVDHQRGRLEDELRSRPEVLGLEPPGHLEVAEVAGIDLVERGVASVPEVSPVGRPLAVGRALLCGGRRHGHSKDGGQGKHEACDVSGHEFLRKARILPRLRSPARTVTASVAPAASRRQGIRLRTSR